MLKCVSKIITGALAISCLSVAALNVRLLNDTSSSVKLQIPNIKIANKITENNKSIVQNFETKLAEIDFSKTKSAPAKLVSNMPVVERIAEQSVVSKTTLINFDEPVKLQPIKVEYSLPQNLVALMPTMDFNVKTMVAEVNEVQAEKLIEDKVSMAQASVELNEEEPIFFDYPAKEEVVKEASVKALSEKTPAQEQVTNKYSMADYEKMADEFIAFDYSENKGVSENTPNKEVVNVATAPVIKSANTAVNKAKNASTKVMKKSVAKVVAQAAPVTTQKLNSQKEEVRSEKNLLTTHNQQTLNSIMSIQAKGTNLKRVAGLKNFEVRFQDDLNEIYEDFGAGEVQFMTRTNHLMNRSVVMLKRGYAPTNTDLIVENNSKVTLPLIDEQVFNELLDQHDRQAAAGALLVEFDDETETVLLDSDYAQVVMLDGNLKITNSEDYRYKLFVGVSAGNVYLTYKNFSGTDTSKIVHIHEREVTFDANIYENVKDQRVTLFEEGLLSKELAPLIISGDQVRVFATENVSVKLNQNTYKISKKLALLGERHYLEVNHLSEPVFVGYRDNHKIALPSEDFMQFVLSRFEDRKLGNRCIIQINIDAPVANFNIASESAGNGLMTSSQVLDQDGKFYDSAGPKSNKIIILGENFGSLDQNQDGKVNIKLEYLDGTTRYLSSYCSPNTYLVEQL